MLSRLVTRDVGLQFVIAFFENVHDLVVGQYLISDVLPDGLEAFLDVGSLLCAGLHEGDVVGVCQLLPFAFIHHTVLDILFVPDEEHADVVQCMLLDLLHPIVDIVEGGAVIYRVGHDDAHGALVVGLGDCAEPLLTSSVPDLHLDLFALDLNGLDFEINA